jgi:hypothetical protein
MNAYDIAKDLDREGKFPGHVCYGTSPLLVRAANMLRQQADRIERKQELIREQTALLVKQNNRIAELSKNVDELEEELLKATHPNAEPVAWMSPDSKFSKTEGKLFYIPLYPTPQIKELSDEEIKPLLDRIQNYLECGGFFNPECMEHDKVRDLIMDCRAILKKASEK